MYTQCDDKCAFHKGGDFIRLHSRVMLLLPDQHLYCMRMLNRCLHPYLISVKLRWTSAQLMVYSKHNRIKASMYVQMPMWWLANYSTYMQFVTINFDSNHNSYTGIYNAEMMSYPSVAWSKHVSAAAYKHNRGTPFVWTWTLDYSSFSKIYKMADLL